MTSEKEGGIVSPEQYVARHKRAFRVAFDYLNAHFPPTADDEYWDKAVKDLGECVRAEKDEPLASELLIAIFSYLEKEYKLRRDLNGQAENRDD